MPPDVQVLLGTLVGVAGVEHARDRDALEALELLTADEQGWTHDAFLSAGEVMTVGPDRLALGLWRSSATTANLARDGRATLQAIVDGAVVKIRLTAEPLGPLPLDAPHLEGFLCRVVDIAQDRASYAEVLSGVRYRLIDAEPVLARWRSQLAALAALVGEHT